MKQCLSAFSKATLLWEAKQHAQNVITAGGKIRKIGRIEERRLDGLYCWFCENHSDVLDGAFAIQPLPHRRRQRHSHSPSSLEPETQPNETDTESLAIDHFDLMIQSDVAFGDENQPFDTPY
jgi:hypothetical protein